MEVLVGDLEVAAEVAVEQGDRMLIRFKYGK